MDGAGASEEAGQTTMDSFTLNKIAGAVLGTCLVGMGIKLVTESVYEPGPPAKPGFALPNPKSEGAGGEVAKAPEVAPIAVRLAKADPKRGEADAKVCSACHNFQEGAGAKIGPGLYGVVDRPKGQAPSFDYSAGMKNKGGNWTYADLDQFITKPSAYVQGTKMGYPGEEDADKRADIISWLRTLAKTPAPLPQVSEADKTTAAAGSEAKPAEDAKTAGDHASGEADFLKLVGSADPKKGQASAQVCSACHNLKKGGGALIGPALWNVVDRQKGSVAGYDYSDGLKKKGGDWSVDDLNAWLTNPAAYIPGTKMGYPGEADAKKRAEIIAFLRTLSDHPVALPGLAEGAAKADKDHPGEAKNMPADAKPGDQKPPAPPNKPGAQQPVPQSPEPSTAVATPKVPDEPRPGMPAPPPTHDEAKAYETKPEAAPAAPAIAPSADAPEGPEPYTAADPIAPTEKQAEQSLPKDETGAPSLNPDGFTGSDQAPEPYSAPGPSEAK